MSSRSRLAGFLVLFSLGLLAGVWILAAPFVVGFTKAADGTWTNSIRTALGVGAAVFAVSAIALLTLPTALLRALALSRRGR